MPELKSSFLRAVQKSRLMTEFVRRADLISGILGLGIAAPLLILNRSVMSGHVVLDAMTLSGLALVASSAVLLPAERWPVLKRASGALGLAYIGLLLGDAWGKPGAAGLAANCVLATATCLSMVFEKNNPAPDGQTAPTKDIHDVSPNYAVRAWTRAVEEFKEAPIFWTSAISVALKPFSIAYGIANHEELFVPYALASLAENATVGLMDNKVKRFFGVTPEQKSAAVTEPVPL